MQPFVGPWLHGLLTASSSGSLSYEKVTTPVKNCPGKMEKTNVYSLNVLRIFLLITMISVKIAFYDTSLQHPRRPDFFTSTSFFLASTWWQMKTEKWSESTYLYATDTVTFCCKIIHRFLYYLNILHLINTKLQILFLTKAVAVGKFLDISLSRVHVLTSQISSGLSLNTTARYCLK